MTIGPTVIKKSYFKVSSDENLEYSLLKIMYFVIFEPIIPGLGLNLGNAILKCEMLIFQWTYLGAQKELDKVLGL